MKNRYIYTLRITLIIGKKKKNLCESYLHVVVSCVNLDNSTYGLFWKLERYINGLDWRFRSISFQVIQDDYELEGKLLRGIWFAEFNIPPSIHILRNVMFGNLDSKECD